MFNTIDLPRRILIVNVNWVGDALFSTPAIRALRKKYPSAHIASLAPPRVQPVFARNPDLDEALSYNDRVSFFSPGECFRVLSLLRRGSFDTAIFFHRSKTKVWLAKMAGIRRRIGYSSKGRDHLLTDRVEAPMTPGHKIDHFLALLEGVGIPSVGRQMEFVADPAARTALDLVLTEKGISPEDRYVVVHAGGNWALKRWPVEHFAESIRAFSKEFGCKAVLCGTESERGISEAIISRLNGEAVSLCGRTSLDALAHLLGGALFLLSNDSGPIHLAASQQTKILGVFGPTSSVLTGPVSLGPIRIVSKDVGCAVPCYFTDCSHRVCMEWISPQEVLSAARELIHG